MRNYKESLACAAMIVAWSIAFGISVEWLVVGEAMSDTLYTAAIAFAITGAPGAWYASDILVMNFEHFGGEYA